MIAEPPRRGEIYLLDPGPTVGGEQAGRRPYLVLSIDPMNGAPAELAILVPLTTTPWSNPLHVRIEPEESGLPRVSYAMPEMARTLSMRRFERLLGKVEVATVDLAASRTGFLLGLGKTKF